MVNHKTIYQPSYKPKAIKRAAFKTGIFFASFIFAANTVFGTPKIMKSEMQGQTTSSIYAQLSMDSQSLVNSLQSQVNSSGLLPSGTTIAAPFVLQVIAEYRESLSQPSSIISSLEGGISAMKRLYGNIGYEVMNSKIQELEKKLAVLRTFVGQTSAGDRAKLLSEISDICSKTLFVPAGAYAINDSIPGQKVE